MADNEDIVKCLLSSGIEVLGEIVKDVDDEKKLFIHVPVLRDSANRQNPSNRKIKNAEKLIGELGFSVEFLLSDAEFNHIELGLRSTLFLDFEPYVRNVFLSSKGDVSYVWVEQKKDIPENIQMLMENKTKIYLEDLGLKLGSILNTVASNLPGKLVCLNVIRQLSPAVVAEIEDELRRRDFTIPSRDWLRRRLDVLRKDGSIVRTSTSTYSLSQKSLVNLGTAHDGSSPDVSKLLALARMGS